MPFAEIILESEETDNVVCLYTLMEKYFIFSSFFSFSLFNFDFFEKEREKKRKFEQIFSQEANEKNFFFVLQKEKNKKRG